ncbi:MAG TPA: hypothetical protein VGQ76_05720 [Thermoanaerobaculia bacterium]|nr:hypothetical protein [Thermoanaerobaculia bacterium]
MVSILPESDLRQDFARRRTRQWLLVIPMVLAIIAIRAADTGEDFVYGLPSGVVIGIGFALLIGGIIFSLINWRCPACSKYLGKAINPTFCGKCGFKLK